MRKIPFTLMLSGYSSPANPELTLRKALLTLIWFVGSASLTFAIVYLYTIAPIANSNSANLAPSHPTPPPAAGGY